MIDILVGLAILSAVFMGISIGASTVAPAFGPVNSSGSANVLRAALLAGLFAFLGAVTQGGSVTETVGSGLVIGEVGVLQATSVLFVAASLVIISVLTDYPMPTAFTVIGGVAGSTFAFSNQLNIAAVQKIVGYWLIIPFVALVMGYVFSVLMRKYISKENSATQLRYLLLLTGSYVAYSAGASAVGLAVGPLSSMAFSTTTLLFIGGFAILAGAWMYSPRIIKAVSYDYSNLGPRRSVAALATSAILAQVGILFGIPISFNEAIIASVIGSGMVEGDSNTDNRKILFTAAGWVSAFFIAGGLTYVIGTVFS